MAIRVSCPAGVYSKKKYILIQPDHCCIVHYMLFKVLDSRGQHSKRASKWIYRKMGLYDDPGWLLQVCVPSPYGEGTHTWGYRQGGLQVKLGITDLNPLPSLFTFPSLADGIFSLVTSALRAEKDLQSPPDIQRQLGCVFFKRFFKSKYLSRCLTTRLAPLFAKSGLEFKVEHVDTVPQLQPELWRRLQWWWTWVHKVILG